MILLLASIAPSVALAYFFYIRDKYEKEPQHLLIKAFFLGAISVIPVMFVEMTLNFFNVFEDRSMIAIGYTAFIVAGLVEEGFKFLTFYMLIWRNHEFDEMYDAIVYCVFVSLGFATVENIGYVLATGFNVAFLRSVTAVPAHALFGVSMGYYLGIARFAREQYRAKYFRLGLIVPIVLHGIYNFILMTQRYYMISIFILYVAYLWRRGMKNVKELVECSPYKETDNRDDEENPF